jgi:hypothetical protein
LPPGSCPAAFQADAGGTVEGASRGRNSKFKNLMRQTLID